MEKRKILGLIFQIPLVIVVIGAFFASIYAIIKKLYPLSWATPVLFGAIIALYFIGSYLKNKPQKISYSF